MLYRLCLLAYFYITAAEFLEASHHGDRQDAHMTREIIG